MGAITRSEGYMITVGAAPVAVAGGGYSGCTAGLDAAGTILTRGCELAGVEAAGSSPQAHHR